MPLRRSHRKPGARSEPSNGFCRIAVTAWSKWLAPMNDPDLTVRASDRAELDRRVEAFESSGERGPSAIMRFLPPRGVAGYLRVLCELVRIDLEHHRTHGDLRPLDAYRDDFPELFDDPACLRSLIADDRRLRRAAGESVAGTDLRERFGVTAENAMLGSTTAAVDVLPFARELCNGTEPDLPMVGDEFLGFRLESELGRGSFGSV